MGRLGEDITFGQLRTFVCVARMGSFVKAADRLGISQPAVSDQIATLERKLGRTLFLRRRGTTPTLTQQGSVVLQDAERILEFSKGLFEDKEQTGRDRVRISIGPLLRDLYLKSIMPQIYSNFPYVEIDLAPAAPFSELISALENGDLDLVVYSLAAPISDQKYTSKVCDAPVAFVARPGTQAALSSGQISLDSLEFLIPTRRDPMSERWVTNMLAKLEIVPRLPPRYLDNAEMVLQMAREGKGVAYLMVESIAPDIKSGALEILELPLPPMQRVIAQSPNATQAVDFVHAELNKAMLAGARLSANLCDLARC